MVDIEIVQLGFERELVTQHFAEGGNVPLAVPEGEEDGADRVLGFDPEGTEERPIGLGDPEFMVEDEERFPDGIQDVEQ